MHRTAVVLAGVVTLFVARPAQQALWQADLQIKTLTVSESKGGLTAKVVVLSELGEAMAAKVEMMLPVGVGIVEMGAGCVAGPSAPGVPALRAKVICTIGNLRARDHREFSVTTTTPPIGMARRFGVMATSDTPDPQTRQQFRGTRGSVTRRYSFPTLPDSVTHD